MSAADAQRWSAGLDAELPGLLATEELWARSITHRGVTFGPRC